MVSVHMESVKPQVCSNLLGQNDNVALSNLIQAVVDSPNSEKLSSLSSNFDELVQCRAGPPFETIWFYSALRFRGFSSPENDPSKRVDAKKDLFQLTVSCSASCNPFKSISLIAPVIYNVVRMAMGLKAKKEKKFGREVKGLVDSVLGYVNVCCEGIEKSSCDVPEGLVRPVRELVDVWMWDNKGCVRDFLPLLTGEVVERVSAEGCELSALAGCVTTVAFLLKLCLRFLEDGSRKEFQDELSMWIITSITGFRNPYFFACHRLQVEVAQLCFYAVLRIQQTSLLFSPPITLQNSDDEKCLRKILYNAVVLVEYSFLKPERMDQLSTKHVKRIIMTRLLLTAEAIELHRKQKDQRKAISYTNVFSGSTLPSSIIMWIRSAIGTEDKASEPISSSPAALLRWILKIGQHGVRIFDNNMSKTRAKLLLDSMTEGFGQPISKDGKEKLDTDLLFYIDNKAEEDEEEGDEQMNESTSAAFVAADHTMQSAEPKRQKRKGKDLEHNSRVKFLKYSLHENSGSREGRSSVADSDDSSSGSEVEN
ncbi:hypothetical protein A4A49_08870 [Nicotiana attenuata]|uniref:Uncharacterized protein n=1 Tax=Nicotiana attenuata TaxID=49451 RepID=A0A1J6IUK5_NICAT|nr:hypothetical protein A4A49_08870 [Nicotiana attenuata]